MISENNLVWVDLEMTGLNPTKDVVLEIASVITDSNLHIVAQGPSLVIHQDEQALSVMEPFVINLHTKSGLLEQVKKSNVTVQQAEEQTVAFILQHCKIKTAILSGNSVWQDRGFLVKYMPKIIDLLHYRIIDVSSIKTLVHRWYADNPRHKFKKSDNHRALEDVLQSVEELKHYRTYFFVR